MVRREVVTSGETYNIALLAGHLQERHMLGTVSVKGGYFRWLSRTVQDAALMAPLGLGFNLK